MRPLYFFGLMAATFAIAATTPERSMARTTGILLADDKGTPLYAENSDQPRIPASITKLLTCLSALETLGPGYRFETWVGYDPGTTDVFIKGFGDPLFISEQIREVVDRLIQTTGAKSFNAIILDHSFFHPNITIPGTGQSKNPYDATTGALCANFNTISFKRKQNRVVSAEPQTPLLDIFKDEIRTTGLRQGRVLLSRHHRRLYPGLLVKAFLEEKGIPVTGPVTEGAFPAHLPIRFKFKSDFAMDRLIEKLLEFSNNFMANQLMLTMGAQEHGAPATLEKGVSHLAEFAETKLGLKNFILKEGSGVSRQNRFSPEQMLKILMAFMPHHQLLKQDANEFYKTGTLSDVRTRAGYFLGKDNRLYPFVIMVNQTKTGYADIRQKLKRIVLQTSTSR